MEKTRRSTFLAGIILLFCGSICFAGQLEPITPRDPGDMIQPVAPADDQIISPTVVAVPEPATIGMVLLGGALLAGVRRYSRKR